MQDFSRSLNFRRDVVEAELNVIIRYLKRSTVKKQKGTSKSDTVKNVLIDARRPLHYFEVGKRLLEPKSKQKHLNGITTKKYLEKAR